MWRIFSESRSDLFTFIFVPTEHGWFQAHAYQFEEGRSTFIVETTDEAWRAAGIDQMSQEEGIAFCERIFAPWLQGERLISNASHLRGSAIWIRFPRVICGKWVHWTQPDGAAGRDVPVVLMGDAAHTAHFSIGSGTKLALEDAIELCNTLKAKQGDLRAGLAHYEDVRGVEVLKIQNAARNSTEWFENVARYAALEPEQFAYSLLTRSQRISHENLRVRDPQWLADYERWLARRAGAPTADDARPRPPLLAPYTVRGVTLKNRVVVSPTLLYASRDGVPDSFHLVHLGSRALGGAGLLLTEATAVSAEGRMTPGCPGLWNDEQVHAWKRVTGFVHANSEARIGVQLNHAGRRGSTQLGWERPDHPLAEDNWPLVSASAIPYLPGVSQVPREASREDLAQVRAQFAEAARRAAAAGFDWIELQAAHGCLLSSFISPLTNRRDDEYGGSLENRLRFPLDVLAAVREAWPAHLPISVRISSTDWAKGGTTVDDAVEIAKRLRLAGADVIDVSSGEVTPDQKPVYGRMYQAPTMGRSLCTSFRSLDKHWDLSFDIVATRAIFARQSRRNSVAVQIACTNLPWGVGHDLLRWQNPIVDKTPDHVMSDAEQFRRVRHRQPLSILIRRLVGSNVAHLPYRSDTVCGPGLALAGANPHPVQRRCDVLV